MRLQVLFSYQAHWGTEENRGPPLVLAPSPPDSPHCSLKGLEAWESHRSWNNVLTMGSLQCTARHVSAHRPSDNGWELRPTLDPRIRCVITDTKNCCLYLNNYIYSLLLISITRHMKLVQIMTMASEKNHVTQVLLRDSVHNACVKMAEGLLLKEGYLYSVWGERPWKRPVYNGAPLIFSSRLLCDHERVGIKSSPPLLKWTNSAALINPLRGTAPVQPAELYFTTLN